MQYYPGKYFISRDMSSSYYVDDTYAHQDMRVLAPCEANSSPEVVEDEQYEPVAISRPYAHKIKWLKRLVSDLSPTMKRTFFALGASCHQGGIHRVMDMPRSYGFLPQTLWALERRKLIIFHGGRYSMQRIEMTEFGKELWMELFKWFMCFYYGDALDVVLESVFSFESWGKPPPKKEESVLFDDSEFSLLSVGM